MASDFFSAQFADDRLHTHSLHADAGADGVDVFVFRHDGDLGALAGFASDGADDDGAVVNLRYFGLEEMLDQFRRRARGDYARTFRRFFYAHDNDADALAHGERFETRLFFAAHAGFGLADIENDVGAFEALDGRVDDFVYVADVFVVDGVAFGLAYFLKNDLLGKLRGDAAKDAFGRFGDEQFSAGFGAGVELARLVDGHLKIRIFDLLGVFDDRLHRVGIDLAAVFIEDGAQVFLRLVVFARGDDDGVFHGADYNLGIDSLFAADPFDDVVELTCHKIPGFNVSKVPRFQSFNFKAWR